MHIPDGFLNPQVTVATAAISGVVLGSSIRALNQRAEADQIPLMGMLASFVFLLQLFSFPIIGATSVHLNGALLVSIILGPRAGFVVMSSSLIVLALLFQHGGIFSLGANILNIGVTGCFIAWGIYRSIPQMQLGIMLGSILGAVTAALLVSLELTNSDMFNLELGLQGMLFIYTVTGALEGVITILVIRFIKKIKPEILESSR